MFGLEVAGSTVPFGDDGFLCSVWRLLVPSVPVFSGSARYFSRSAVCFVTGSELFLSRSVVRSFQALTVHLALFT